MSTNRRKVVDTHEDKVKPQFRDRWSRMGRACSCCVLPALWVLLLHSGCGNRESQLILLHTNDMHAWFAPREEVLDDGQTVALGGAPVLAGLLRAYRDANPGGVLYLDAGDLFQGTPISGLTEGLGCVEVMNLLAPDAFTLGNHEFDYGMEAQRKALALAAFPVIQANVRMIGRPHPYLPADILTNCGGLQVAILGLNSDALFDLCDKSKLGGVRVDSSEVVARKWLKQVTKADLRICLSHRGFVTDSLMALTLPGFDLIVGGHSHTLLRKPVRVGSTWIVQAGDKGRYLGVDTLNIKPGKGIVSIKGGVVPILVGAAEPDAGVAERVAAQEQLVNELLGEEVAALAQDWVPEPRGESNIGNWLCAAIRKETGAQIGLWNSGGIRKGAPAGRLALRDFWEISPFGNKILVVPLSGSRIREIFQRELDTRGLHMQFDGMRMSGTKDKGLGDVLLNGKVLDDSGIYRVAMSDYVWGQIRAEADSSLQVLATGRIDRDLLIDRARAEKQILSVKDGRWGPGRDDNQR